MRAVPKRGLLTDALFDYLEGNISAVGEQIAVGDHLVPRAAGWSSQQPGQGRYIASTVLRTEDATTRDVETLRSRHSTWICRYSVRHIGGARGQVDYVADGVRQLLVDFSRAVPSLELGGTWVIAESIFTRLGSVTSEAPTDFPTFAINDTLEVWIGRQER